MTWMQLAVALAWGTWVVLLAALIIADAIKKAAEAVLTRPGPVWHPIAATSSDNAWRRRES